MPSLQVGAWVLLLHAEGFCMGLGSKEGHCLMHASCNAAAYGTAGSFWKSGVAMLHSVAAPAASHMLGLGNPVLQKLHANSWQWRPMG